MPLVLSGSLPVMRREGALVYQPFWPFGPCGVRLMVVTGAVVSGGVVGCPMDHTVCPVVSIRKRNGAIELDLSICPATPAVQYGLLEFSE
jgi:hypothetical protein